MGILDQALLTYATQGADEGGGERHWGAGKVAYRELNLEIEAIKRKLEVF